MNERGAFGFATAALLAVSPVLSIPSLSLVLFKLILGPCAQHRDREWSQGQINGSSRDQLLPQANCAQSDPPFFIPSIF